MMGPGMQRGMMGPGMQRGMMGPGMQRGMMGPGMGTSALGSDARVVELLERIDARLARIEAALGGQLGGPMPRP
jgi:hypothetical protein